LLLPLFFATSLAAQKQRSVAFNSYNAVGIVSGKQPVAFAAQTENGVGINNWFFGLGASLDYHYKRSMPVFAAIKKQFVFKKDIPFFYINLGSNFILNEKNKSGIQSAITIKGGPYTDIGAGYKRKITNRSSIFFSLGYSVKRVHEYGTLWDVFDSPGVYDKQLKLNRVAIRAGFQF
jgi:hypothetical protein